MKCPSWELKLTQELTLVLLVCKRAKEDVLPFLEPRKFKFGASLFLSVCDRSAEASSVIKISARSKSDLTLSSLCAATSITGLSSLSFDRGWSKEASAARNSALRGLSTELQGAE